MYLTCLLVPSDSSWGKDGTYDTFFLLASTSPSFFSRYKSTPQTMNLRPQYVGTALVVLSSSNFSSHENSSAESPLVTEHYDIAPSFLMASGAALKSIHRLLTMHKLRYVVATISGAPPPIPTEEEESLPWPVYPSPGHRDTVADSSIIRNDYPSQHENESSAAHQHMSYPASLAGCLANTVPLFSVKSHRFCGIIVPHQLGASQDLLHCNFLAKILREFSDLKKPICAIGYGVWSLCGGDDVLGEGLFGGEGSGLSASLDLRGLSVRPEAPSLIQDRLVTAVSIFDEYRHPFFGKQPAVLQDVIERKGGQFVQFPADETSVIVDCNLITGPNEASTDLCLVNFCWQCLAGNSLKETLMWKAREELVGRGKVRESEEGIEARPSSLQLMEDRSEKPKFSEAELSGSGVILQSEFENKPGDTQLLKSAEKPQYFESDLAQALLNRTELEGRPNSIVGNDDFKRDKLAYDIKKQLQTIYDEGKIFADASQNFSATEDRIGKKASFPSPQGSMLGATLIEEDFTNRRSPTNSKGSYVNEREGKYPLTQLRDTHAGKGTAADEKEGRGLSAELLNLPLKPAFSAAVGGGAGLGNHGFTIMGAFEGVNPDSGDFLSNSSDEEVELKYS